MQPITKVTITRRDHQVTVRLQIIMDQPIRQDLVTIHHRNAVLRHREAAIHHRPEAHRRVVIPTIQEIARVVAQEVAIHQVVLAAVVRRGATHQVTRAAAAVHQEVIAVVAQAADVHPVGVHRVVEAEAAADAKP